MGRDGLGDPGAAGGLADDLPGAVPVQPPPVRGQEHRPVRPFPNGQVDRPRRARRQRDGHHLAALSGNGKSPVTALQTQVLDIGASGLRHSQPVQREQRMLARRAEAGGDQQRAEVVAVQRDGMRLVVHPRTADVRSRE